MRALFYSEKVDNKLIIFLLSIWIIPSFLYVWFGTSSYTSGLIITSLGYLLINFKTLGKIRISQGKFIILLVPILILLMHSLYGIVSLGTVKPLFSMLVLILLGFTAIILSENLREASFNRIKNSFFVVIIIFSILGWLNILIPLTFGNYALRGKPVFPFSEESHFALALGLLSCGYAAASKDKWNFFIGLNLLSLAVIFPNLTMMALFVVYAGISVLKMKKYNFTIFLVFLLFFLSLTLFMSNNLYFLERLNFTESNFEVKHLSLLVYLQGWELAINNLIYTNGVGLGFQNLGYPGTHFGTYTAIINSITGKDFNILDGGFLLVKIVSEFGLLGLFLILVYILIVIQTGCSILLFKHTIGYDSSIGFNEFQRKKLLLGGVLLGFLTEVFFRGTGYFSPNMILVLASFLVLY